MAGLPEVWAEPSPESPDCRRPHGQTPQNPPGPHAPPAIARQGGVPPAVAQPSAEQRPCDLLCLFFPWNSPQFLLVPRPPRSKPGGATAGQKSEGEISGTAASFCFPSPLPLCTERSWEEIAPGDFSKKKEDFPLFPSRGNFTVQKP